MMTVMPDAMEVNKGTPAYCFSQNNINQTRTTVSNNLIITTKHVSEDV